MLKNNILIFVIITTVISIGTDSVWAVTDFFSDGIIDSSFAPDSVRTWNSAIVDINNGVLNALDTFNTSTANLNSGSITQGLSTWNSSTVNIFDGAVSWFLEAHDTSKINIYGGQVNDYLFATDSSAVNIYGLNFDYNPNGGSSNGGQLTGLWQDNTPITIDFTDNILIDSTFNDHVALHVIPEPATLSLLAFGSIALIRRK